MRTITVHTYTFDELKTDEAREKARDWWRALEAQDPAWWHEHNESLAAALRMREDVKKGGNHTLKQAIKLSKNCNLTGYCADVLLAQAIKEQAGLLPSRSYIQSVFEKAWEDECCFRMEDEQVDESIIANGYEFLEDGTFVTNY